MFAPRPPTRYGVPANHTSYCQIPGAIIAWNSFVIGHSYRVDDSPTTLTYPDGEVLTYGYDARGLLTTLSGALANWGGTVSTAYLSAARV